jgi:hypothetical protein
MISIALVTLIIILGIGALVYPEEAMDGLTKVGLTMFGGMKNQTTRNNRFRGVVILVMLALSLLILGGLQVQIGLTALVIGILLVYYSSQLVRTIGFTLPQMGGMTPNTILNIAGLLLIVFGVGWMTGFWQDILQGILAIFVV